SVRDDVIDEVRTRRRRKAYMADLDRRGALREDSDPGTLGMALQVNRDMDAELADELGDVAVGASGHIEEAVEGAVQTRPHRTAVVRAKRNPDPLEVRAIVPLEHLRHDVGGHVLMEVGRGIGDAN